MIRKIKNDLKIKKLHLHQFRKTFAQRLYENGCSVEIIQKLLDHSDIKTTMIYLEIYNETVKSEFFKYQKTK